MLTAGGDHAKSTGSTSKRPQKAEQKHGQEQEQSLAVPGPLCCQHLFRGILLGKDSQDLADILITGFCHPNLSVSKKTALLVKLSTEQNE